MGVRDDDRRRGDPAAGQLAAPFLRERSRPAVPDVVRAPRGFVCTSTPGAFRVEWRTRGAGGRWVWCGLTLALGLALPAALASIARHAPDQWAVALLFSWGAVAFTLQLIPLRRRFFLELSSGRLVTDSTLAPRSLSSVRRACALQRMVVRHGKEGTTTETWHELWLHLEGGACVQVGSRMSLSDAVYLSELLHLHAPHVACTQDFSVDDLSEPGRWMSIMGGLLTAALVMMFGSFQVAVEARQSSIGQRAFALAGADPAVTGLLGAPLAWGWTAKAYDPRPSAARFSADVSGPRGASTLHAAGYFKNGDWCFVQLQLRTSHGALPVKHPGCTLTASEIEAVYYVPPPSPGGGH